MDSFKQFLENKVFQGIKPDDITWWANYSKNKVFKTPEEAREWVYERREFADRQSYVAAFGGPDGPEYNRAFANAIPLYQSGKSLKIGKRIKVDHRLRLKDLQIKMPDWSYVIEVAQSNGEADFQVHKVKLIPIRFTVADQGDYYMVNQKQRIEQLAWQIKENRWIEPVIYEYPSMSILEGQHRARAMKLLGFNMIPGVGIEYEE